MTSWLYFKLCPLLMPIAGNLDVQENTQSWELWCSRKHSELRTLTFKKTFRPENSDVQENTQSWELWRSEKHSRLRTLTFNVWNSWSTELYTGLKILINQTWNHWPHPWEFWWFIDSFKYSQFCFTGVFRPVDFWIQFFVSWPCCHIPV